MAQAAESTREPRAPAPQPAFTPPTAVTTVTGAPQQPAPTAPVPSREPAPAPVVLPPLDLAAISARTDTPAARERDRLRATFEDAARASYASEDTDVLRLRAGRLAVRIADPTTGPRHARELARSLLEIRDHLARRSEPIDAPPFDQHPRWRLLAAAPTPDPADAPTRKLSERPGPTPTDGNLSERPGSTRADANLSEQTGPTRADGKLSERTGSSRPPPLRGPGGDLSEQPAPPGPARNATPTPPAATAATVTSATATRSTTTAPTSPTVTAAPPRADADRDARLEVPPRAPPIAPASAAPTTRTTAAETLDATTRTAGPHRPPVRRPAPARATTTAPPLPEGAILLTDEPVTPLRLLRHATAALFGRLPASGRTDRHRGRTITLPEAPLAEPGAREILDGLAAAVDGKDTARRALTPAQRLQALRAAWTLLDRRIAAEGPAAPDVLTARDAFEAAYEAQQQSLLGLEAAESQRRALAVDPTARGLAAPTLADTYVEQQFTLLLPALDDLTKGVVTLTRSQARDLGDLSNTLVAAINKNNAVPADFPALRFGFLAGVTYLRATLNTIKGLIAIGDLATPGKLGGTQGFVNAVALPGRLLEGLLGGLFLTLAAVHVFRNDNAAAAHTLARYTTVGRGLVWTAAFAQLAGGLANTLAAAVGSQEFKRSYLFDIGYGGAGALAPIGTFGSRAIDRKLLENFGTTFKAAEARVDAHAARLAAGHAEAALPAAEAELGRLVARRRALASIIPLTATATTVVFGVDLGIQIVEFGREQFEKTRVGAGLSASLRDVERLGADISGQAYALAARPTSDDRARKSAADAAVALHSTIRTGLFALRLRHEHPRGDAILTGSYAALGRRLAAVDNNLGAVRPDDPQAVLRAAREVLAGLRGIFRESRNIYAEELKQLDNDRILFGPQHTDVQPPKP